MTAQGARAPDFTLPGLDGLNYALHEATGKGPVLLAFWQAGCGACRMSAPYWNRLYDAYEQLGWSFWTISQDAADDARTFIERYALKPTVLVDGPRLEVSDAYDPESTPTLFLIDPEGGVSLSADGFDKDALNDVSRQVAAYAGADYVEIAPADDGQPAYKPG